MGHYDENRKFDEEWRANNDPMIGKHKINPVFAPKETEINTVRLRVEHLTPQTFKRWTDGPKWILDTMGVGIDKELKEGVGTVAASPKDVHEFLHTYPHPVGTFYLIADLRIAVRMVENNPTRDIRVLLVPK